MASAKGQNFEKQIDTQSIRKHVEKLLENLSLEAESLDINPGSNHGENYMGSVAKVQAITRDFKGNQRKFNWIVKKALINESYRRAARIEEAYEREVQIYQNVIPAFEKLQEELEARNFFESYAKFYYYNLNYLDEVIILEDMKALGYKMVNRKIYLDLQHVLLVVREYAKLHALSFVLKDRSPQQFFDLKNKSCGHYFSTYTDDELREYGEMERNAVLKCLDPSDQTLMDRARKFLDKFVDNVRFATKPDDYSVFTHGDCWVNNFLFRYGNPQNPNSPTDVCFLDFQISSVASPILDVSYFLLANTDTVFRNKYYNFIFEEYYSSLSKFIKKLGSDPEILYPLEVFRRHVKDYACFGFCMTLLVIKLLVSDDEEVPDFSKATSAEEIDKMFNYEPKNLEVFQKRVNDLVQDGVKFEYL